ncbi:MAG: ATPase domain-containing protein [Candidatus Micrarchaeia archaeon]
MAEKSFEIVPARVSTFDNMIERRGIERGSVILVSGGCGTGKSTFCMQSLYNSALIGEKAIYISFEEPTENLKFHMKENYGWDIEKLEKKGDFAVLMLDPFELARRIEAAVAESRRKLMIKVRDFALPFVPKRVAIDSLTALSTAFMENIEEYRIYLRYLFKTLSGYNAITFAITETEQEPQKYSHLGVEEFLSDAVIVFYNLRNGTTRQRALEILKLRWSAHCRRIVPYEITNEGIVIRDEERIK